MPLLILLDLYFVDQTVLMKQWCDQVKYVEDSHKFQGKILKKIHGMYVKAIIAWNSYKRLHLLCQH